MGETAPFWRFSAASYPDLERPLPAKGLVANANQSQNGNVSTSSGVCTFCSTEECLHAIFLFSMPASYIFFSYIEGTAVCIYKVLSYQRWVPHFQQQSLSPKTLGLADASFSHANFIRLTILDDFCIYFAYASDRKHLQNCI